MHNLIKKLSNFRLSALLEGIIAIIDLIAVILCLAFYQTSGNKIVEKSGEKVKVATIAFNGNLLMGMIYFILSFAIVVLCLTAILNACKYVFPKQKLEPSKSLGWILFATNVCLLVLFIIIIYMLGSEGSNNFAGYVIALVIGFVAIIASFINIYPMKKCRYYTPELLKK